MKYYLFDIKKLFNILIIIIFIPISSPEAFSTPDEITHPSQKESIQAASEITKALATAEEQEKDILFTAFRALLARTSGNNSIRDAYINNLIAHGRYDEGLHALKQRNKIHLTRLNLLTQCMLQERLGYRDNACYNTVVSLSEKDNAQDSDYLSALFFAEDKRFHIIKEKLTTDKTSSENDFHLFTIGREELLYHLFP